MPHRRFRHSLQLLVAMTGGCGHPGRTNDWLFRGLEEAKVPQDPALEERSGTCFQAVNVGARVQGSDDVCFSRLACGSQNQSPLTFFSGTWNVIAGKKFER